LSEVAYWTVTSRPATADWVTVKVALRVPVLPSVTLTSLTRRDGTGSSSMIVPVAVSSPIVFPADALDS